MGSLRPHPPVPPPVPQITRPVPLGSPNDLFFFLIFSRAGDKDGYAASAPPGSLTGAPDYSASAPPGSPNDLFFSDPLLAFSLLLDLLSLVWGAAGIICKILQTYTNYLDILNYLDLKL